MADVKTTTKRWGGQDFCPACQKVVYPMERVYGADRKPFHRGCINCQVLGCSNELIAREIFRHDGYNICRFCNEALFNPKTYGPGPGGETMEERRLREAREEQERLEKLKDIEEELTGGRKGIHSELPHTIKIAETVTCL